MNTAEAGQLLTMLVAIDRRSVGPETATAWAWALADIPAARAREAAQRIIQAGSGYVDVQAIRRELKAMQPQFERDVRSAKARGLVPKGWDAHTPLSIEVEDQLRAAQKTEWIASNDESDAITGGPAAPAPLGVHLRAVPSA